MYVFTFKSSQTHLSGVSHRDLAGHKHCCELCCARNSLFIKYGSCIYMFLFLTNVCISLYVYKSLRKVSLCLSPLSHTY